ncbi:MAG TPA: DUF222 domain-containing protein [Jatrophihabitans sp.]|nr:DUF222 domain-containing protein [Jatrophihabitans sp.]
MSTVLERVEPCVALRALHAAIDALQAVDWTGPSDGELVETLRELERARRRLPSVEHQVTLEATGRGLPGQWTARTPAAFLRRVLGLGSGEAAARVRAAEAAGARRTLTGEPLAPLYPSVAAAQAAGTITAQHAARIVRTLESLPDSATADRGAELEAELVGHAQRFNPEQFATLCQRLLYCYDQDGPAPTDGDEPADSAAEQELARRHRNRFVRLSRRADGSSHGEFEATAELTELLLTHFDSLAGPKPAATGTADPRSLPQRRHDALIDALRLAIKARLLPRNKGVTATVIVTMTEKAYRTGRGCATTGHGATVPAREALRWGRYGGDLSLLAAVLSKVKPVEAYSTKHRFHSENQRLLARILHGGCTFPGCSVGPEGCQTHHVEAWAAGGATCVNLAAPVCARDHAGRVAEGWEAVVLDNRIAWIPPARLDPKQTPQFNDHHLPLALLADIEEELGADRGEEAGDAPDDG